METDIQISKMNVKLNEQKSTQNTILRVSRTDKILGLS